MTSSVSLADLADVFEQLAALIRKSGGPLTPDPVEPPQAMPLTINAAGLSIIQQAEGCKLEAYRDPAGVWTIGWGHTAGVTAGQVITQAQADMLLAQDLAAFEQGVAMAALVPSYNEFSAMVSLAYNIGLSGFKGSTVLRLHNAGDKQGAAGAFALWNKAGGKVLAGLVDRRAKEAALYLTP